MSIAVSPENSPWFSERWDNDRGFVAFFDPTSQNVTVSLRCNSDNKMSQVSLYQKGVYISDTAVMLADEGSDGKNAYILFVYESDNAIHAYTLANFNGGIPIAGTYIPEKEYWSNFYSDSSRSTEQALPGDNNQSSMQKQNADLPSQSNTTTLTKEEQDQLMIDEAGVPQELRLSSYVPYPEVTLSGYMKDSMTFIPDEK